MAQAFDHGRARERLDGRIAFVAAAFATAFAFAALLDRVGAPPRFVETVAPCFTIAALAALGFMLRTMRVSLYYVAGRAIPTEYAGFALGALAAAFVCVMPAQFAGRSSLFGLAGGTFLGIAIAGCGVGPLLRKSDAFSLSGLFAQRFASSAPRLIALSLASLTAALVAMAGQQAAVDGLTEIFGGGRVLAAVIVGAAVLFVGAPGGLFGALWAVCAAGAVAILGFGWPLLAAALQGSPPFDGAPPQEVSSLLTRWGALSLEGGGVGEWLVGLSAMIGAATLAPLLAPAIATQDAGGARRAGLLGCGWALLFAWLVASTASGAALSLARQSVGLAPERLPDAVFELSARGELTLCGRIAPDPVAARAACGKSGAPLAAKNIAFGDALLLTGLPRLEGMSAGVAGLTAAARVALALALAAAGLQAFGTTLGHEALYRMRRGAQLTSRRLATTRLSLTGLVALGVILSGFVVADPAALAARALCFSGGLLTPLAGLTLWPRIADRDALTALVAGLVAMAVTMLALGDMRQLEALGAAALAGAVVSIAAGSISAYSRPCARPEPGEAFVSRLLHGDGGVVGHDRGA
ncbi:MAG TPA: hypothetical protein VK446_13180 [Methylocystis sp.]|nr:hypothetical protein [Methylocystis sp.]